MSDHEDIAKFNFPLEVPRIRTCPVRALEIGADNSFRAEGLEPEELRGLLAVYREHMELMMAMMAGPRDAVRYRPDRD